MDRNTTRKNAWRMPNSYLCTREDSERDTDHLLVQVLKRNGIVPVNTVHKEYGTILLKGCFWNSLRVDVQFSLQRLQCPEVKSKSKGILNCRYTMQPIWKRLRLFFAKLFLQISSVFKEKVRGMCGEDE